MESKRSKKMLSKMVLAGLATGALFVPFSDTASATTLTEYKMRLAQEQEIAYAKAMEAYGTQSVSKRVFKSGLNVGAEAPDYGVNLKKNTTLQGDTVIHPAAGKDSALQVGKDATLNLASTEITSGKKVAVFVDDGTLTQNGKANINGTVRVQGEAAKPGIPEKTGKASFVFEQDSVLNKAIFSAGTNGTINLTSNAALTFSNSGNQFHLDGGTINLKQGRFEIGEGGIIQATAPAGILNVDQGATLVQKTPFTLGDKVINVKKYGVLETESQYLFTESSSKIALVQNAPTLESDSIVNLTSESYTDKDANRLATVQGMNANLLLTRKSITDSDKLTFDKLQDRILYGKETVTADSLKLEVGSTSAQHPMLAQLDFKPNSTTTTREIIIPQYVQGTSSGAIPVHIDAPDGNFHYGLGFGGKDGELLTINGDALQLANIKVGPDTSREWYQHVSGARLQLGVTGDTTNHLSANVVVGGRNNRITSTLPTDNPYIPSELNVLGGHQTIQGRVTVLDKSSLSVAKSAELVVVGGVDLNKGSTAKVNGTLRAMVAADHAEITVGDADSAGALYVTKGSSLTGSHIFLDPDWSTGWGYSKFIDPGQNLNYTLGVGRNSAAMLGTATGTLGEMGDDATKLLDAHILDSGQILKDVDKGTNSNEPHLATPISGNVTAALYLGKPINVSGRLYVDGNRTTADSSSMTGDVRFAKDSLLVFDGRSSALYSAGVGTLAIPVGTSNVLTGLGTATSTLMVQDGAKLFIENALAGNNYNVATGFYATTSGSNPTLEANGWATNSNYVITNRLVKGTPVVEAGTVKVNTEQMKAEKALPHALLPNNLNAMIAKHINNVNADDTGIRFLSDLITWKYSNKEATYLINTAAQAVETVGATRNALMMSMSFGDAEQRHLSFFESPELEKESNVWAKVFQDKLRVDDAGLNRLHGSYDTTMKGFVAGFDFPIGKKKSDAPAIRVNGIPVTEGAEQRSKLGLTFSYTEGDVNGFMEKDDYTNWGVGIYGSYRTPTKLDKNGQGRTNNLLYDLSYGSTKHEVEGLINANPHTKVLTLGLTDEYRIRAKDVDLIPHVGLRYLGLRTGAYSGYAYDKEAFRYAPADSNVWLLPIGVGLEKHMKSKDGKTNYRLAADLSYVGVLSGNDREMRITVPGIGTTDVFSYDVMDNGYFKGEISFGMKSASVEWGLGYRYLKGDNSNASQGFANLTFKF